MKYIYLKKIVAIVVLLTTYNAFAEAPAKEALCKACHGAKGLKPILETYPKIGGQNKDYLVTVLKAYKDGSRKGGLASMMVPQAKTLSDKDIDELSEYYSKQ